MLRYVLAGWLLGAVLAAQPAADTVEFTLFKRAEPIQVGEVGLILRSTDVGKQRFALVLLIDGHRIERKDLDIKIPLYFYVGDRQEPHELVVMRVGQDQIVGRLRTPIH
jgi:hypothetical protein